MKEIKHSTVLMSTTTAKGVSELVAMLSDSKDPTMNALLAPYNEVVSRLHALPDTASLVRHDVEDGSHFHGLAMMFGITGCFITARDEPELKVIPSPLLQLPTVKVNFNGRGDTKVVT